MKAIGGVHTTLVITGHGISYQTNGLYARYVSDTGRKAYANIYLTQQGEKRRGIFF